MSTIAWFILGAVGASVLWMFALAWLLNVIAAQRKAINSGLATVLHYRETRDHSDAQVRALLDQNERLARQLIERAADSTGLPVVRVPATWFSEVRES